MCAECIRLSRCQLGISLPHHTSNKGTALAYNPPAHHIQAVSNDAFHTYTTVSWLHARPRVFDSYIYHCREIWTSFGQWPPVLEAKHPNEVRWTCFQLFRNCCMELAIPIHLQTTTNTNTFKCLLKTYLFTNYLIAFIVHLSMTMQCLLDYCVIGRNILLYVCMYSTVGHRCAKFVLHTFQSWKGPFTCYICIQHSCKDKSLVQCPHLDK